MKSLTPEQAARLLQQGAVVAYPTEGVYGLGSDPFNETAVRQLLALKHRPAEKGLILIAAHVDQILPLISVEQAPGWSRALAQWPGPVTWVFPAQPHVPAWIRGQFDSVAVRVSAHLVVRSLCEAFGGPVVSTSANPSGQRPALSCRQVEAYFGDRLAGCVIGALGGQSGPTPIFDGRTGRVLRGPET